MRFSAVAALSVSLISGCATIQGILTAPSESPKTGLFAAGAAVRDITPPPGFPMGGHSIAGQVSRGYWTRLRAKSIYVEDENGHGLLLVSCDLWSMPAGVADVCAELIQNTPEGAGLGRGQMIFAATHTHQSPGNFSSCVAYNAEGSPQSGFDERYFKFLTHRIASAAIEAIRAKQPAVLKTGLANMDGVARNRSMDAFLRNPEASAILASNSDLPVGQASPEYPSPLAFHAINPALKTLSIESQTGAPIAVMGFLGIHPTTMSHETEVYDSDCFGVAERLAEGHLGGGVVALFNGSEGDVSPVWTVQNRATCVKIGEKIGEEILRSHASSVVIAHDIAHAYDAIDFRHQHTANQGGASVETDGRAVAGKALFAGAEDGRTWLNGCFFHEGLRRRKEHGNQGVKYPALDFGLLRLNSPVSAIMEFPTSIPLGVVKIGPMAITAIPFEPTTVTGRRIANSVASAGNLRPENVLIIGLANEYVSYLTTPDEYDQQDYEGASTLYGRASEPVVEAALAKCAQALGATPAKEVVASFKYHAGFRSSFGVRNVARLNSEAFRRLRNVVQNENGLSLHPVDVDRNGSIASDSAPAFHWIDRRGPNLLAYDDPVTPQVAVEFCDDAPGAPERWLPQNIADSDAGANVVVVFDDLPWQGFGWRCLWLPKSDKPEHTRYRFRVTKLDNETIYSKPFSLLR